MKRVAGDDSASRPSTYDRAKARRRQDDGPSLANVYAAYRSGRMSPEQSAQYEHDVNAGSILLPPGTALRRKPAAPALPAGVIQAYNNLESGMTVEQRHQIDQDLQDGLVSTPRGARLNPWRPMTTGEEVKRGLGLGTRSIIEGVGDVAGLVMNPLNTLVNATGIPQKLPGQPLAMANDPGINLADALGLPKPQFETERTIDAISRGATGGMVTYGAGSLAAGARGLTGAVGRAVASAPVTDFVSGATGGGSADLARREGFGPAGQMAAGLLGGGAGVAGAVGAERTLARTGGRLAELPASTPKEVLIGAADELTEEGQEMVARHGFSPEEIKRAYADAATPGAGLPADRSASSPPPVPEPVAATPRVRQGIDDPAAANAQIEPNGEGAGLSAFGKIQDELPAAGENVTAARSVDPDVAARLDVPADRADLGGSPQRGVQQAPLTPVAPFDQASAVSGRTPLDRTSEAEALGIPLTRGQATQDFATQDAEQTLRAQASRDGDKARIFLTDQADKIKTAVTQLREAFGPTYAARTERGQAVKDALRELRDRGKAGINALYREAESMGGGALPLKAEPIVDAAKRVLVEADVPDGVKNVVRQEMARYGLLGKEAVTAEDGLTTVKLSDGRKIQFYGSPEALTVANAETFRQAISAQYAVDGPRKLSQAVKGAIDGAVEAAIESAARSDATGPVGAKLQQARSAVVAQKETFSAKDVVQRLVDWRKGTKTDLVMPDHAMREIFAGEISNLKRIRALLLSDPTDKSKAGWRAVQAEGLGQLFEKAYTVNANIGGGSLGSISGAKLNSEIVRFGIPKLKVLLDEADFNRLMSLRRVIGEATIPIQNTTNPSGSAFKLMRFLTPMAAKFSGIPLAGPAIDVATGLVKQARATAEAQRTLAGMTGFTAKSAARDAAARAPAASAQKSDEAADGLIRQLVAAVQAGRLVPSVIASIGGPSDE
ncbi:hypothetical protein [Sphingomonas endolithica]|uniref:hypothetical protein n=1 Tax=Sphingomonas endolithica TaxID=2972485 RepID=UPI0021AFAF6F|nr:hypothetical protein [Sphingomonas sp. ZFBP2030]